MNNCTIDCIEKFGHYEYQATCSFVQAQCHQNFLQFIQGYFCGLHSSFLLFMILGIISFACMYLALNALTEHALAPAVQNFIDKFHISHTLAGVTFLAFANGAPDVLTAIIAGNSSSRTTVLIPFGSIFGALLFGCVFIFSSVIFVSPGQRIKVKKNQILVPLGFYIVGILYVIIISIIYKKMNIYLASALVVFYLVYIAIVLKTQKKRRIQHKQQLSKEILSSDLSLSKKTNSNQVVQGEQQQKIESPTKSQQKQQVQQTNKFYLVLQKVQKFFQVLFSWLIPPRSNTQVLPVKNIISLIVSPFVMGLSQNIQTVFVDKLFQVPIIVYLCVPALLLIIYFVVFCIYKNQKQIINPFFSIYSFFITVCWVTIVCSALINLMQLVQLLTNINSVYLGLTFLAFANSIGDYLSITMFAKRGKAATAISGIFSGQLFNFLIGFGFSMVVQAVDGEYEFDLFNFSGTVFDIMSDLIVVLVICSGLLFFVIIAYLVPKLNGQFKRKQGVWFRYYYFAFILISSVIAISTDFFREFSCVI